ncbi:MAG: hypothetical protein ACFFE7_15700 [Candidatus Thorarchaeota archaeon]
MNDMKFKEYWWVYLKINPKWDNEDERHEGLMKGHFSFINRHAYDGNLFAAIPMSPSGGQYWFDGELPEEQVKEIIANEPSIGTVFIHEMKRAYVQEHLASFTLEEKKRLDQSRLTPHQG